LITYTTAIVGVGKLQSENGLDGCQIGYQHARNLAGFERVRLAAGMDINPANLKAWQREFQVAMGYLDYEEMLRDLRPDTLCLATYVGLHYPMIEKAARAGVKGILCEKPFLNSPAEIGKLRALVRETGIRVVVNHMRRYQPMFLRLREILRSGRIGKPELFAAGIDGWDLSEWGAHWLDIFRFLNDDEPVQWVMGQARTGRKRAFSHHMEEHAVTHFHFANGCTAVLDGGHRIGDCMMSLVGSEGCIRLHDESRATLFDKNGAEIIEAAAYGPAVWLGPWNALLDWIEGADEPDLGATNQLLTSELNHAAYVSALRGDRVDLPLVCNLDRWPVDLLAETPKPSL
jgi:predicted dehydrogenase